jgi:hypothetical protein
MRNDMISAVRVDPDPKGAWRVSTPDGSFGGVFTSRKAALAFARGEAGWAKNLIVDERSSAKRGRNGG